MFVSGGQLVQLPGDFFHQNSQPHTSMPSLFFFLVVFNLHDLFCFCFYLIALFKLFTLNNKTNLKRKPNRTPPLTQMGPGWAVNRCLLQMVLETDRQSLSFSMLHDEDLKAVISHMTASLKRIFPDSSPG